MKSVFRAALVLLSMSGLLSGCIYVHEDGHRDRFHDGYYSPYDHDK